MHSVFLDLKFYVFLLKEQIKEKISKKKKAAKFFEEFPIVDIPILVMLVQEAKTKSQCLGFDARGEKESSVDKRGKKGRFNGRSYSFK